LASKFGKCNDTLGERRTLTTRGSTKNEGAQEEEEEEEEEERHTGPNNEPT
jgi:hypothetical protein